MMSVFGGVQFSYWHAMHAADWLRKRSPARYTPQKPGNTSNTTSGFCCLRRRNALQSHRLRANRSVQHEANSLSPRYRMARHLSYRSDKLSRLTLPSELIECYYPFRIRSLAKGGRVAPMLRDD